MNNKLFYVINEDGMRVDARILSKFKLSNNENYITYTYDEYNEDGMIKIYVTGIEGEKGNYSYKEITTDEEWNSIKTILKTLAKSEEEEFPESIKSDLTIIGEEVSVRRPKKLLVSSKFADVLESKYTEEEKIDISSLVNLEEAEEPVKEEVNLEKTIKIPTFEELQARNKNIQTVMENAKEEKPVVEPVKEEIKVEEVKSFEPKVKRVDYEEQFKKSVEPVLLDVYAKQQKHIEELEEELSKTKFDLFEKQKEALSLSNEKDEIEKRTVALEQELDGVQKKMNGILSVLQGSNEE
ncbi:MAG: DUF1292 domain-containing protein [Bacilli bacterium]|nr:DUF1292 domain-containing protein [Bacilli bacterium]